MMKPWKFTVAVAVAGIGLGVAPLAAAPLTAVSAATEVGASASRPDMTSATLVQLAQAEGGEAASSNGAPAPSEEAPAAIVVDEVVTETVIVPEAAESAAQAVAGAHGEGAHGGNVVDEHAAHFPPFDVTTFPSQLLWLVVTFVLLYLLMSRVTLPRIGRILEERRDRIADDLEEGIKHKAESEAAQAAYEKALNEARAKANAIAGETRAKLAEESDANRKALEAGLTAKLEAAEQRIAATKSEALSHVRGIAVDTAEAIVSSLVGAAPAKTDVEQAVDTALAQKDAA
ncbi:F0F1 ATP synthase subunit B [Xanthobacter sp. TB0139]|uniref:F0F1 ATP synthase subunit B n=1 Tax=Xanthobacter sp. TB0139 TaxID=3459178 RepID=UPI004039048E